VREVEDNKGRRMVWVGVCAGNVKLKVIAMWWLVDEYLEKADEPVCPGPCVSAKVT